MEKAYLDTPLRELMLEYVSICQAPHIEQFIERWKEVIEYLQLTARDRDQVKYPNLLSMTPGQILEQSDGSSELKKLVRAFIRRLPFTERLDAMFQFNDLFDGGWLPPKENVKSGEEAAFCFSVLKDNHRRYYFGIKDLLNQTEIEILLLKRMQINEFAARGIAPEPRGASGRLFRGGNTRTQLAEEFNMSTTALDFHLDRLQYGTNLLGHDVKIDLSEGGVAYDDSVHPVFLTLNPSEAMLLTVGLKQKFAGSDRQTIAEVIADDIYGQLSEQYREKVDGQAQRVGVRFETCSPRQPYRNERGRSGEYDVEIAHKRPSLFVLRLASDPLKPITGVLNGEENCQYKLWRRDNASAGGSTAQIICRKDILEAHFLSFVNDKNL